MTRPTLRTNIRMTPEQYERIVKDARDCGMSTNRYMLALVLAGRQDRKQLDEIKALIAEAAAQQTAALAGGLSQLADEHSAHDKELRDKLNVALHTIDERVARGVAAMTRGAVPVASPATQPRANQ